MVIGTLWVRRIAGHLQIGMGMKISLVGRCGNNSCAEVEQTEGGVVVTSTLQPGQRLDLTAAEWSVFVEAVKVGVFDATITVDASAVSTELSPV